MKALAKFSCAPENFDVDPEKNCALDEKCKADNFSCRF